MIDRHAFPVDGLECDDLVVHALGELPEHVEMGSGREAGVGNMVYAIQDHAPGGFQEMAVGLVMGQVHDFPHLESQLRMQLFDDVRAPLAATILCLHGIQHDRAVRMKADPVVGKYRVRRVGLARVVEHDHVDACFAQRRCQALEFRQGRLLLLGGRRVGLGLEIVRIRRLRIALKALWPDHQDARCQL